MKPTCACLHKYCISFNVFRFSHLSGSYSIALLEPYFFNSDNSILVDGKKAFLVKDVKDLAYIIKEALYLAKSGRPGPVHIDIPKVYY